MDLRTIRRISIEADAKGVEETASSVKRLGGAHAEAATSVDKLARSSLTMEQVHDRMRRQYEMNSRLQQQFNQTLQQQNQMMRAANDNAQQMSASVIQTGADVLAVAGHLKFLAVAAYGLSPAFRSFVNPAITAGAQATGSALAAMSPGASAAAAAVGSRLVPALTLASRLAVPILAISAALEVVNQTVERGSDLLDKYGNAQRNLVSGVDANLKSLTRFQDDGLSAEQVQRATELGARLIEAKRTIEEFSKIQFDLTNPALALQAAWVGVVETIAAAVDWANKLPQNTGAIQDAARRFNNRNGLPDVTEDPRFLGPEVSDKAVSQVDALTAAYERLRGGMGSTSNFAVRFGNAINDLQNPIKQTTQETIKLEETVNRFNQYDNAVQRVKDQIEVLELQAQSYGKNTAEVVRLRTELDLKRAAQRAGVELSQWDIAVNEALAKKLGTTTEKLQEMNEARRTVEQFGSALVDALTSGADAADRLVNSLAAMGKQEATKALTKILNNQNLLSDKQIGAVQGATALLGAGALGYQVGSASGSRLTGALGGAAAGAMAGAATGNVFIIAGGAVVGAAAGYFGGASSAENAKVQGYQDNINFALAARARITAAQQDLSTRAGQIAAFEAKLADERAAAALHGAGRVAQIEKAHAAERIAQAKRFAEADLERQKHFQDRAFLATTDLTTCVGEMASFQREPRTKSDDCDQRGSGEECSVRDDGRVFVRRSGDDLRLLGEGAVDASHWLCNRSDGLDGDRPAHLRAA